MQAGDKFFSGRGEKKAPPRDGEAYGYVELLFFIDIENHAPGIKNDLITPCRYRSQINFINFYLWTDKICSALIQVCDTIIQVRFVFKFSDF